MTKKERKRKKKLQMYNKRLIKKYYFVAPRNVWTDQIPKDYDYTYINWGWCKGWDKTFGMMYLEELGKAIKDNNIKNFRILEQKEKYGCYDSKTEVLTKNGWKYFSNLSYEDEIATLNPKTNFLEYQKPTEIIAEHYNGKMYKLENRGISLCVTPNHNLYVAKGSSYRGTKGNFTKKNNEFELCNPTKYYGMDKRFLKTCKWNGVYNHTTYKIKGIEYDSLIRNNENNNVLRHYINKDLEFDLIPWLRFLGFYIAEGYVTNRKNNDRYGEISISFNPYDEEELVKKIVSDIGFEPKIYLDKRVARFNNLTLGTWLNENCGHGAINKKVPSFIKDLPPEYIREFLEYLYIGDGHKSPTSNILTTISKQLSNDVQELLLKAGFCFRESIRDRSGQFGGRTKDGYQIISKHPSFEINWLKLPDIEIDMSKAKKTKSFCEEWVNYSGCVYCVTVPNHIIYIRRNGKGIWCGNSARNYVNCYTDEIDNIINKYEHISRNVCMYCGCETPTIDDGWVQPICFDCYEKLYRRRMSFITRKDYIPDTDEKIRALYESCIIDEPDENGEYHIPKSYTLIRYSKDSEEEMVYDISDTVNKIQKRIAGYKKGEDKWKT